MDTPRNRQQEHGRFNLHLQPSRMWTDHIASHWKGAPIDYNPLHTLVRFLDQGAKHIHKKQWIQDINTSINWQKLNREQKGEQEAHTIHYKHFPNHFNKLPIGNKKDMMSIHSNEPSRPPSRKEIVSWKRLLLRSVENTNLKNQKSQYTQEHE